MKYKKVKQVAGAGGGLFCLCEDGTIYTFNGMGWTLVKGPTEEEDNVSDG